MHILYLCSRFGTEASRKQATRLPSKQYVDLIYTYIYTYCICKLYSVYTVYIYIYIYVQYMHICLYIVTHIVMPISIYLPT